MTAKIKKIFFIASVCLLFSAGVFAAVNAENRGFTKNSLLDISALYKLAPWHDSKVIVAGDTLISNFAYPNETRLKKNVQTLAALSSKTDIPVYFAIPPRKLDVLPKRLIEDYPMEFSDRIFAVASAQAEESGAEYIDIRTPLLEAEGYTYMRTDHHWTAYGAYFAYCEILKAFGQTPYSLDEFEYEKVSESFYGSDHTKLPEADVAPDEIYLLHLTDNKAEYKVTIRNYPYDSDENNVTMGGLYNRSVLGTGEEYNVFLSGVNANVKITALGGERETLLVVCDSFGLALSPFLALHYDLVLIDVRYYSAKISDILENDRIDKILLLENMGSLCEQTIKIIY